MFKMIDKSLFINQLLLTVAGSILTITGFWSNGLRQVIWYQNSSVTYIISGIILTVIGPFSLYILKKKTDIITEEQSKEILIG